MGNVYRVSLPSKDVANYTLQYLFQNNPVTKMYSSKPELNNKTKESYKRGRSTQEENGK
jgi:hypothetical protein